MSRGASEFRALLRPGMAFANPGVVYMATPGWPVMRAHASAMWTAACSWRVSMNRKPMSAITSMTGRTWSPASANTLVTPSNCRARPIRWLPVTIFEVDKGTSNSGFARHIVMGCGVPGKCSESMRRW